MPKRSRTAAASSSAPLPTAITLHGGHAQPPRTVDKFREGKLCDVQLEAADGTAFAAHVLCLTAGSAYFEALYSEGSAWSDANRGTVSLPELPAHALATCLEFIYTGSASLADIMELPEVLEAAAYLQMPELQDAAASALTQQLAPSTALQTWEMADRLGLASLSTAAAACAARHFDAVVATEAWPRAPLQCVRHLLGANKLVVGGGGEVNVYEAAIAWLRAQAPPLGADESAALLGLVRFPLLPRDFYHGTVRAEPLLRTPAGLLALTESLAASAFGDGVQRRIGFERLYAIGGECAPGSCSSAVVRYDPAANRWETIAPMGTGRYGLASAAIDGKLYAVGGSGVGGRVDVVERYDPATNRWETIAPMGTGRY